MFRLISILAIFLVPALAEVSLETLRRGHPRLIALDSDVQRIRESIKSDPAARRVYENLVAEGRRLESVPPIEYKLIGPRLLTQSRRCLERVYLLALLYRIQPDPVWLNRALKELRTAAAFRDWNPSHFLDTAEMTHALAIGYDWLYPALSAQDRSLLRTAIVQKGLEPALEIYENRRGWSQVTHNWNQVCNGGITIGALAVAEDEPSRSEAILRYAVASIPLAMSSYAPDGGWNEGPGYWHYATRYNVYFLAALETALGTVYDLTKLPGFDRAGHFRIYFSGPSAQTFNYADAGAGLEPAEEMLWLAREFNQPVYADQQLKLLASGKRAHALDLVWFPLASSAPQAAGWPRDSWFRGVQTVFLRGSWDDPDAPWIAVKGGDNKANHSHLDLGSFVLDSGRQRWASDLGGDDYNLPLYFGKLRWTYYRLRTESHNTVLIDGENQDPNAKAAVTEFSTTPEESHAVIDLTAAYPSKLREHIRTVRMIGRSQIRIEDQIQGFGPVEALWGMMTSAAVKTDGRQAWLTQQGRELKVQIEAPSDARFEVISAEPPKPQNPNTGMRKLVVRLPGKVTQTEIVVSFLPASTVQP